MNLEWGMSFTLTCCRVPLTEHRSLNKYSSHGITINPYQPLSGKIEKRYPGGSSGGSAAAVAAGMCQV